MVYKQVNLLVLPLYGFVTYSYPRNAPDLFMIVKAVFSKLGGFLLFNVIELFEHVVDLFNTLPLYQTYFQEPRKGAVSTFESTLTVMLISSFIKNDHILLDVS